MWLSVFRSSRSNILGLTAAKRKVKERPREKVTGGGIQCLLTPLPHLGMIRTIAHPLPLSSPPPPQWVIPHWSGPLWWSQFGGYEYMNWYWSVMVIAFCFYHFLIGCLWAEILTAIVWQNSVKSWQTPIFCPCQYLWRFLNGRPLQCGREYTHKSRAASGNSTLGDCTWRVQHLLGEVGEHQPGLGEVSRCGLCRAKTVRRCLCACANI